MKTYSTGFKIHSNGRLRANVTAAGHGGLFQDWIALTRYQESTPDCCGPMVYISEGTNKAPAEVELGVEIGVPGSTDVEIRKITIANLAGHARTLEITTYTEIALNHPMGDAGHPAFSKLFVQTSISADENVLMARRRPRGMNENWPWMAQTFCGDTSATSWETNRATFLGRGRSIADPAARDESGSLSCQTGNVLDPVMAWRFKIDLPAGAAKTLWLMTAAAPDEEAVLNIMAKCRPEGAAAVLFQEAADEENSRIAKHGLTQEDATRYQEMAGTLLAGDRRRVVPTSLTGATALHRFPLSGEEIRIIATEGLSSAGAKDILRALPFWKDLGLKPRLFVIDRDTQAPEGVDMVDPSSLSEEEMTWWLASAQLLVGEEPAMNQSANPANKDSPRFLEGDSIADVGEKLQHFNGYGGFSANGKEYVIPLDLENGRLKVPPMPWCNVLANPDFGCIVTERGAGYTWARNSQANRLTPWSNDPIRDPHGEALYLQDEDTGEIWSPLPGPCAPRSAFVVRHGFGRTRFSSELSDISQTVQFLVPPEDRVKLVSVTLKNLSGASKNLRFASYQKLLLCSSPDRHHATLAWTGGDDLQHASNPRAGDFQGARVFCFTAVHGTTPRSSASGSSSSAFFGNGNEAMPASLSRDANWARVRGFGRDACFSRVDSFELAAGAEIEIVVGFGEVMDEADESRIVSKYSAKGAIESITRETLAYWEDMLGGVKVDTPLPEVDLMVNGWLLYQNLACRIWGRSAFYQSGGAFGFRDQLQDSGALAALHPELMREQILLHAAQQFPEGDVTHWWHPQPMGTGMRTKFSDDLLWLPYLTDHYLLTTGDDSVLDETRPFIEGPLLGEHEDEEYMKPAISGRSVSVFEHCCLAIDKSLTKGTHGLPLIGIGDWNDGMSRIGREGRGESVWMGFFLYTILNRWIPLCKTRGETDRVARYALYRDELLIAINDAGWDGEWYRRAYYDDGTPLGTRDGDECKIDALAQAWAVISKSAPADRVELSLDSLQRELIDPEYDIIRLLYPPFVNTPHDPGYIKGYVAGVRENGGQYTHAACWVIRAMAEAGRRREAADLLQRLSPVWHSRDERAVARYQVEPYVVAADIYGAEPHNGRGGWTWYTGSAGWMFRVAVESVLGLKVENGDTLVLDPRVPDEWPGYSIRYRTPSGKTTYQIEILNPNRSAVGVHALKVDGQDITPVHGTARWPMLDDGGTHEIEITLGAIAPN